MIRFCWQWSQNRRYEDMLCTFLPLAKGDLVDHVLHTLCTKIAWGNEGAMQEQQIAAFADDRHAWRNLVVACSHYENLSLRITLKILMP